MGKFPEFDLAVIGGGAAGFFGALAYAEAAPGRRVVILEKAGAVLGKVRISGGGRCNVTHACFDPAALTGYYPRGARELRSAFARFQPRDTLAWFEQRGVALKTEADGRIFPTSDSSETIVRALTGEAKRLGIEVRLRSTVERIEREAGGFWLRLRGAAPAVSARQILLTTGGDRGGFDLAAQLGHAIVPPVPSLFTFQISDARLEGLAGVSVPDARLALPGARLEQRGPVLITHWGLSGPGVLRLSAWGARALHAAQYQAELRINWAAEEHTDALFQRLWAIKQATPRRAVAAHSPFGAIPQRLWQRLAAAAGIGDRLTWSEASRPAVRALAEELCAGRYQIHGKGAYKEEFVTCGGVALGEVDFRTLASRVCSGLYLAGEVLDIDGLTGGFNFQNAWTTGYLAGWAAAQEAAGAQ